MCIFNVLIIMITSTINNIILYLYHRHCNVIFVYISMFAVSDIESDFLLYYEHMCMEYCVT